MKSTNLLSSSDKRLLLRELLFDFIDNKSHYSANELQQVRALLQCLNPVCPEFEEQISKTPGSVSDDYFPPIRYPREVIEIDMYGNVTKTS